MAKRTTRKASAKDATTTTPVKGGVDIMGVTVTLADILRLKDVGEDGITRILAHKGEGVSTLGHIALKHIRRDVRCMSVPTASLTAAQRAARFASVEDTDKRVRAIALKALAHEVPVKAPKQVALAPATDPVAAAASALSVLTPEQRAALVASLAAL